jgi:hypothetical protein
MRGGVEIVDPTLSILDSPIEVHPTGGCSLRIASWSIAVLLVLAPVSFAQTAPEALPLQTTSGTGFTGAPYSGKQTTVKTQTLTDGSTTTETYVEFLWRDAEGRTRREIIQHTPSGEEYRQVIITDPVTGLYLKWLIGYPSDKKLMHIWPNAQHVTAPIPVSKPPSNPGATTPTPGFQREVFAPQEINGVYAEGSRWARTIRLTEESGKREIEVSNEIWISPDLKIIVRHLHDDPRTGKTATDVTDVVRGDPDPALFQAPKGYQVVDHRPQNSR